MANDDWTLPALKEYVDQRFDAAEREVEIASMALDKRVDLLNEFRQQSDDRDANFARLEELAEVKRWVDLIVSDHVQRRDFDTLRDEVGGKANQGELTALRDEQIASRGRRAAGAVAVGIIVTVFIFVFGFILNQGLTNADVSQQIEKEAPWNRDKPAVTARIAALERAVHDLEVQIARLQAVEASAHGRQ